MHRYTSKRGHSSSSLPGGRVASHGLVFQRRSILLTMAIGSLAIIGFCILALGKAGPAKHDNNQLSPVGLRKAQEGGDAGGEIQEILESQSAAIRELTAKLKEAEAKLAAQGKEHAQADVQAHDRIRELEKKLLDAPQPAANSAASDPADYPKPFHLVGPTADCEERFGLGLADVIRKTATTVCETPEDAPLPSSMTCYPFKQPHKKNRDRPWDNFCVAHNFVVDFSKVGGMPQSRVESHAVRQGNYHTFDRGSLSATCRKTPAYRDVADKFMPHHRLQMESFIDGIPPPDPESYVVVDTPTYLLARDEDCENLFHSMADHMNTYLVVEHVLKLRFQDLAVVLFDRHVDGPFFELIQTAFSPNHPLKRAKDFQNKKVLFKTLIFHLESPAGIVFPSVTAPEPMRCHSSTYYHAFRRHVLQSFGLWDVPPPPIPSIVLSVRKRTPEKNVGRVMVNENEVVNVLKQGSLVKYQVVDLGTMSFKEQLQVMRHANIYIGIHGAGLMHAYFLAEEAILMEIHPSYRLDRHFRLAARQAGKIYMPLRLTTAISCQGTSDSLTVDVDEFRQALDGAVRIARSFDQGVAECGLKCPASILALDNHLDPHYAAQGLAKAAPLNTRFPC